MKIYQHVLWCKTTGNVIRNVLIEFFFIASYTYVCSVLTAGSVNI